MEVDMKSLVIQEREQDVQTLESENPQQVWSEQFLSGADIALSADERRELMQATLPEDHSVYADKYFLRSKQILEAEGLNPYVRAQVFIRKGPGTVYGVDEALAILDKYSDLTKNNGVVFAKKDGDSYESGEALMFIDAQVQDIVELETMYLGVIAAETTRFNDGVSKVDLEAVTKRMSEVVKAAEGRPVIYFGARHWDFREDAAIANAAIAGGAIGASTDIGAGTVGKLGQGTIPHLLENVYAYYYGKDNAVVEATKAFDRVIDKSVPRIALIDYNNKEVDDSVATAKALDGRLAAVRVDTCGENVAQGALSSLTGEEAKAWKSEGLYLPEANDPDSKFWAGTGVTVTGVYRLRKALDEAGFPDVQIVLTSGFGDPNKVKAFVRAEEKLGVKLFDSLGVGGVYEPCRTSTMDVVLAGGIPNGREPVSKVGRTYKKNPSLEVRLGDNKGGYYAV